ncbi:MAG: hypothetical protein ACU84Q_18110 [Gammaproteobacteria bacterium]
MIGLILTPRRLRSAISLCFLIAVSANTCAEEVDTAYFAKLLFEAKSSGNLLPDIYRINPGVDERTLYAIQKQYVAARLAAGEEIGGFKGGFIPAASAGGVLFGGDKVLAGEPELSLENFRLLVVEAEVGFRFCKEITQTVASIEALKNHVCEIMPVVEIADGAIADFAEVKKNFKHLRSTLIAMNVASSHTLVGKAHPVDTRLDMLPVSMHHNGEKIGERDLNQAFKFWQNVLWIVNDFVLEQGYSVKPGQFIIAGNLTGIHAAKPGIYEAKFGPLGNLRFSVE